MNPLARGIEELLPARLSNNDWCFVIVRITMTLSTLAVALLLPFFGRWSFLHTICKTKHNFFFLLHVSMICTYNQLKFWAFICRNCDVSNWFRFQCFYGNDSDLSIKLLVIFVTRIFSQKLHVAVIQCMIVPPLCFLRIIGMKNASALQVITRT